MYIHIIVLYVGEETMTDLAKLFLNLKRQRTPCLK